MSVLEAASIVGSETLREEGCGSGFIGDGPEKPRLKERVRGENIKNVFFDDSVPRNKVYDLLKESNVLWVTLKDSPLYRWGISLNKLYDYLAAARIGVRGKRYRQPGCRSPGGPTVPPENPLALAEAIKELLYMSPEKRWEMGLCGREYVERYHSFARLADKLEKTLKDAMKDKG